MSAEKNEFRFDTMDIMIYIWKRKIPLLLITIAAGIVSIIGSLMITPKFKSTVVLFATAEASAGKVMIQENYQKNMQDIGDEEQVEPVLQVLKSDKIRDQIIKKYNLMQHYGIDTTTPYPHFRLFKYYASNVQIKRTEYNSIVITVLDADPAVAASIANDIADLADPIIWEMKAKRARIAMEYLDHEIQSVDRMVRELRDTLKTYNRKGVISFERQIERFTEYYGQALLNNNSAGAREIERQIQELGENSSEFVYYWGLYNDELNRINKLRFQYLQAKAELDSKLPNVFILDRAQAADKKAYPKKSVIVIVSTFSAFLLSLILFIFFENFLKRLRSS
jgi:uncharacterized protein involved in exopolysaccharide biosynthesis